VIPKTLAESFEALDTMLKKSDVQVMEMTEGELRSLHFSLGMHLRNTWGLWKDSDLAQWFNKIGITHPDDMSDIVLASYWRHKHEQPLELTGQVQFYKDFWEKQNETTNN